MATIIKEGLTFDDVLLVPQKSEVLPQIPCKDRDRYVSICDQDVPKARYRLLRFFFHLYFRQFSLKFCDHNHLVNLRLWNIIQ